MYWLTLLELLGISAYSTYLIYNYCSRDVPMYAQALGLISWVMNFTLIALIPLDIFITQRNEDAGLDPLSDPAYVNLTQAYQLLYWVIFLMCWTVIPIVSDYVNAVDFDPNDRLKRSFRDNIKFYILIGALGFIFIVYIFVTGTAREYGLLIFFKAIANCYGVFLIIGLLGYSLVTIPRAQMRTAHFELQLRYLYFRTSCLKQEKQDAKHALSEKAQRIMVIRNQKFENALFDKYIKLSLEIIPLKVQRKIDIESQQKRNSYIQQLASPSPNQDVPKDIEEMTTIYLALKKSYQELVRIKTAWKVQLKQAFEMEDVIRCIHSEKKEVEFSFRSKRKGQFAEYLNRAEWYWHCKYKPQFKVFFAVILGVMSFFVLIQEVTLFIDTNFTFFGIPLKLVTNLYWMQIFTFLPLFYMAFCVYYGMFRIKISGFYGLYPDHQTDAPSLLFTTVNFSRVSAPLCFNFLNMLRLKSTPAFNYAMGNVELIPIFGISFSAIFPMLLIVLCLINYYDLYDRLMNFLGMKQFLFAENFSDRLIYEGRVFVKEARERRQKRFLDSSQSNELKVVVDGIVDGTGGLKESLLKN